MHPRREVPAAQSRRHRLGRSDVLPRNGPRTPRLAPPRPRPRLYCAFCIIFGAVGIGVFQANQAFVQLVAATGGVELRRGHGATVGSILALSVAAVILGGIRAIARVTSALVPVMAALYIGTGLVVIASHVDRVPEALFGS
ncbi:MAG: alanine:cation symporter family protein [Myxococcota bacterium]